MLVRGAEYLCVFLLDSCFFVFLILFVSLGGGGVGGRREGGAGGGERKGTKL